MYKKARSKKAKSVKIDRKVFERLYLLHVKAMYRLAYHYVQDEADNMVQDVFLSLWERRSDLVLENPEHYLNRALKLKIINYFRNNNVRSQHIERVAAASETADYSTEETFNFKTLVGEIDELVIQLPSKCQQVYSLYQEGMDKPEIAAYLNISESAVKQHIAKALNHLRHHLKY